jgi:hypothetical protein
MDILRNPYGQRLGDRRKDIGHGTGKSGLAAIDTKDRWGGTSGPQKNGQKSPQGQLKKTLKASDHKKSREYPYPRICSVQIIIKINLLLNMPKKEAVSQHEAVFLYIFGVLDTKLYI